MKYFTAILLLALFAIAMATETASEAEHSKVQEVHTDSNRGKRGIYVKTYSPVAYASYASPIAYSTYKYPLPIAYSYNYPAYYGHYSYVV